jgi:hypothetical protein
VPSVKCECRAHRAGLDLRLELGNETRLSLRFSMDRVLQSLEQLLEVSNPSFERLDASGIGRDRWIALRLPTLILPRRRGPADLADPPKQSLAIGQRQVRLPAGSGSGSEIATAADSGITGGSASGVRSRNPTRSRRAGRGCSGWPHSGHASRYIAAAGLQRRRHSGQQARIMWIPSVPQLTAERGTRRGGHGHPPLSSSE